MPDTPIWLPVGLLILGLLCCASAGLLVFPRVTVLQSELSARVMDAHHRANEVAERDQQIAAQTRATATMRTLLEQANRALSSATTRLADQAIQRRLDRQMIETLRKAAAPPSVAADTSADPYARMEGLLSARPATPRGNPDRDK